MKRIFAIWLALLVIASQAYATVSVETSRTAYTCNGTTTAYTYPFQILADSELKAVKVDSSGVTTTLALNVDYTVSGAGSPSGGTLTLTSGSKCGSGYTLTLLRNTPLTQETDYVDGEAFSAASLESVIDKHTLILQQQEEKISRALRLPDGVTTAGVLPSGNRASRVVGFDGNGSPDLLVLPSAIVTAITDYSTTIKSADLITKGPWVDVRSIAGVVCDGTTDDAPEINGYITGLSLTSPLTLVIPDGKVCGVKAPITIKSYLNLAINGELRAVSTFVGDAVVQGVTDTTAYDEHFRISGNGIINANNLVQDGISIKRGRFGTITPRVWGATRYGIRLGHSTAASGSYEIHVHSPQVWRGDYENAAGSYGVYHENCTDSNVFGTVSQGYRMGMRTDSGAVHYFNPHAWGRKVNGPMTHSFYINGNFCTLHSPESDTPHNTNPDGSKDGTITDVYAFYLAKFGTYIYGARSYINPSDPPGVATDNLVTAVYIAQASGLSGGIFGLKINDSVTYRHKNGIAGTTTALAAFGIIDDGHTVNSATVFQKQNGFVFSGSNLNFNTSAYFDDFAQANASFNTRGTTGGQLTVSADASGQYADMLLRTGSSPRWRIRKDNGAESGANAGSDFRLESLNDSGAFLGVPIAITRATGAVTLENALILSAITSASAPNNSIFRDSADNIIKIKDNGGVVRNLY